MTTQVTILNHGPDHVEIFNVTPTGEHTVQQLAPGSFRQVYVHQTQDLKIVEIRPQPKTA